MILAKRTINKNYLIQLFLLVSQLYLLSFNHLFQLNDVGVVMIGNDSSLLGFLLKSVHLSFIVLLHGGLLLLLLHSIGSKDVGGGI